MRARGVSIRGTAAASRPLAGLLEHAQFDRCGLFCRRKVARNSTGLGGLRSVGTRGGASARVSRGARADEGMVAKGLAAHRSLTSAESPCRRTGTTVESRYVRIGAVCRFILFCMPIAAFSAEDACGSHRESVRGEATGGDSRGPRQGRKPSFFEARTSAAHLSMIVSASARLCGLVLHIDVRHVTGCARAPLLLSSPHERHDERTM